MNLLLERVGVLLFSQRPFLWLNQITRSNASSLLRKSIIVVVLALGLTASARADNWQVKWTHGSLNGDDFSPKNVALGYYGTLGISASGPFTDWMRLYSSFASDRTPIWQNNVLVETQRHRVAAAKRTDLFAMLHDQPSAAGFGQRDVILRWFNSSSNQPLHTFTLPFTTNGNENMSLAVTEDGLHLYAVCFNMWTGQFVLFGFSPNSATPLFSVSLSGTELKNFSVSANGGKIILVTSNRIHIIDTQNPQAPFTLITSFLGSSLSGALSADGSKFAFGDQGVSIRLYEFDALHNTYQLRFTYPMGGQVPAIAFSPDQTKLVAAANLTPPDGSSNFRSVRINVFDVASALSGLTNILMDHTVTSPDAVLQNMVSKIVTAGQVFAIGYWGDELGPAPEVEVYAYTQATPRYSKCDLAGSVRDLDFSDGGNPNTAGKFLIVASKGQHMNTFGGGGEIDLIENQEGLIAHGIPHAGASISFEMTGLQPGAVASLLSSPASSRAPFVIPAVGTLFLRRNSTSTQPLGAANSAGSATGTILLPALVGESRFYQGLRVTPANLTPNFVPIKVVP